METQHISNCKAYELAVRYSYQFHIFESAEIETIALECQHILRSG